MTFPFLVDFNWLNLSKVMKNFCFANGKQIHSNNNKSHVILWH